MVGIPCLRLLGVLDERRRRVAPHTGEELMLQVG